MTDQQLINLLTKYNFDPRESQFYLEMLRHPEITAGKLHRITGISRPRTYEVVSQMVAKGFINQRMSGKNKFFSAVKPSQLLAKLEQQWKEEQETARKMLIDLEKVYEQGRGNDRSLDFIEVIRSKDMINQRYAALVSSTQHEILSLARSPYSVSDEGSRKTQTEAFEIARKNGVSFKTIFMYEEETWPWLENNFKPPLYAEEEERLIEHLPVKAYVFDQTKVLIAIPSIPGHTESDFTMIILEDKGNAEAYSAMFEMYWEKSYSYQEWLEILESK